MAATTAMGHQTASRIGAISPENLPADLPGRAGVSLKSEHYQTIIEERPDTAFFEVHAENYMGAGGPPHYFLERIRANYPLSVHGVGLSIGTIGPLDQAHLERLKVLLDRYQPQSFSEHLAWSTHTENYFADLLPLPYDEGTLALVCAHIDQLQSYVQRKVLIENPSTYLEYTSSTMEEIHFLTEMAARTGCGLLLDVNNVHVSCTNHNRSAEAYIDQFPVELAGEIHLAGYAEDTDDKGAPLLIDAHGCAVFPEVWTLYNRTLSRAGPLPTLVEWDNEVPQFEILSAEAGRADAMIVEEASRRNMQVA